MEARRGANPISRGTTFLATAEKRGLGLCSWVPGSALKGRPGMTTEFFRILLEVRFAARPTNGPQVPHLRDELYFVAAGSGRYRVEDKVSDVGRSEDFCVWVLFYGPQK